MANLTSSLDIVLVDDVSKTAAQIAGSLQKMEAEAKAIDKVLAASGASDKFAAGLKKVGASAVYVEGATKAWQDYAKAQELSANRSEWTSQQTAQVRNWESVTVAGVRAVMGAEKALEAQREKASAEQRQQIAAEHRAHERLVERQQHGIAHHGAMNFALQSAAMAVSAHAIMHGVETVLEHGAEYQHRLVGLQNAGRTPAEVEAMNRASHAALRGVPTATLTGNLEILNETVGAFGSVEHAMEHLGFMAKSSAILHAVAGDKIGESAGAMGNSLAKFFEMRGTAGNGEVFEKEASEMMKSMIFTGGNVNPRELLNFAQQAKSSLQNYDLHFLSRVAPSLIGEVGGERAGTQANAFSSVILGKANDAKQAAAWVKYHLIDPAQMTGKGAQKTGWTGGAIYHTDEALKDPLSFGENYILPALRKAGVNVDNQLELTKVLGTLFRNVNSAAFANELWQKQNRQRLHKDDALISQVEDPDTIYKRLLKTDPTFAMTALKGAFDNLMTAVSSPVMGTAAGAISGLAEGLNILAIAAHDNPVTAVTTGLAAAAGSLYAAGRLSYGLINGFNSFTPAAGEMVAAGHEQLAAGRIMMTAAEAMRVGAIEHDVPGMMPGGKLGSAVAHEAETLAKGTLTVEALEVAATAGVTLTAGTVALVGLTAAAIIAGLRGTMDPKHLAVNDPGFNDPFAPGKGFDINDPKFREQTDAERAETAKPWFNRGSGHVRGSVPSQQDGIGPGHWVTGRGGNKEWVADDVRPMRNAPFFSTAPLGPDGLPNVPMTSGYTNGRLPTDPTSGSIIGFGHPLTDPRLYEPSDVPIPAPLDRGPQVDTRRTLAGYIDYSRPVAAAGEMPAATPPPRSGVPGPDDAPKVDTSGLDAAKAKAAEVHASLEMLNASFTPAISTAVARRTDRQSTRGSRSHRLDRRRRRWIRHWPHGRRPPQLSTRHRPPGTVI